IAGLQRAMLEARAILARELAQRVEQGRTRQAGEVLELGGRRGAAEDRAIDAVDGALLILVQARRREQRKAIGEIEKLVEAVGAQRGRTREAERRREADARERAVDAAVRRD